MSASTVAAAPPSELCSFCRQRSGERACAQPVTLYRRMGSGKWETTRAAEPRCRRCMERHLLADAGLAYGFWLGLALLPGILLLLVIFSEWWRQDVWEQLRNLRLKRIATFIFASLLAGGGGAFGLAWLIQRINAAAGIRPAEGDHPHGREVQQSLHDGWQLNAPPEQ